MSNSNRRVVITGVGLISPLGNSATDLWGHLSQRQSGVDYLRALPVEHFATQIGGEARDFTGNIDNFGALDKTLKRSLKKGLRLMCREIEMGVAAAQLALQDAGLDAEQRDPERIGTVFGTDYIMTLPQEFSAGIRKCINGQDRFHFEQWGEEGLAQVAPLWLLKYLPNMPASHVAIYNDLRGPSNTLTMREASSNAAIAEAVTTIRRGTADAMLAGATGTRIHPLRSVHVAMQESLVNGVANPAAASRPFEKNRTGMVLGEGAGVVLLESQESAEARSAKILGEVVGYASSSVANVRAVADYRQAFENVLTIALRNADMTPTQVGHVHAHGNSTIRSDQEEAAAIDEVFGEAGTPVTAAKSYMGNLGAGSGVVEIIASLQALLHQELFPILNYETPDPQCPLRAADPEQHSPGDSFLNVNITPFGQASGVLVRKYAG
ncbi:MAG: beta-ketoacyl-[acyl-carrier-protein] synthase family protein [Pirellulaceae bacterium]